MGHKINPTGFRIGVIYDWQAKWYAGKNYADLLQGEIELVSEVGRGSMFSLVLPLSIDEKAAEAARLRLIERAAPTAVPVGAGDRSGAD